MAGDLEHVPLQPLRILMPLCGEDNPRDDVVAVVRHEKRTGAPAALQEHTVPTMLSAVRVTTSLSFWRQPNGQRLKNSTSSGPAFRLQVRTRGLRALSFRCRAIVDGRRLLADAEPAAETLN